MVNSDHRMIPEDEYRQETGKDRLSSLFKLRWSQAYTVDYELMKHNLCIHMYLCEVRL